MLNFVSFVAGRRGGFAVFTHKNMPVMRLRTIDAKGAGSGKTGTFSRVLSVSGIQFTCMP
jgi:hypothetical protein